MDKVELYPEVIVYKNVFPDPNLLSEILIDSEYKERKDDDIFEDWEAWYTFGTQMSFPWKPNLSYEELISEEHDFTNKPIKDGEDPQEWVARSISNAFYKTTLDYIKTNKIELPNWEKMGLTICRYNAMPKSDYAMAYHTDYSPFKEEEPGYKFALTCTIYLNDDYEGGEVTFLNMDSKQVIEYKPYAGDVIMFRSGEPFYHGVNRIAEKSKYFIRLFWGWNYEGSQYWHDQVAKYGEEKWRKMDVARFKKEVHEGKWHKDVVWDEKELDHPRYKFTEENPCITPVYSPNPKIKRGKGNE